MKKKSIIPNIIFLVIGVILIYYSLTAECNILPTTTSQEVQGQVITSETTFPQEINLLLCISASPKLLILSTIGLITISIGTTGVIKKLT
jgi:hypothetical protein